MLPGKSPDSFTVHRYEGGRAHLFGKKLEIHFVEGIGQAVGMVQDHNTVTHGYTPENKPCGLSPWTVYDICRRIIAQHQHIEVVDGNALFNCTSALQFFEKHLSEFIPFSRNAPCRSPYFLIRIIGQVGNAHQPCLMAHIHRGHSHTDSCVPGLFRHDIVDNKPYSHLATPCSTRSIGFMPS